jgi:hypothetical protein
MGVCGIIGRTIWLGRCMGRVWGVGSRKGVWCWVGVGMGRSRKIKGMLFEAVEGERVGFRSLSSFLFFVAFSSFFLLW